MSRRALGGRHPKLRVGVYDMFEKNTTLVVAADLEHDVPSLTLRQNNISFSYDYPALQWCHLNDVTLKTTRTHFPTANVTRE